LSEAGSPAEPGEDNDWAAAHVGLLDANYTRRVGRVLLPRHSGETDRAHARRLYEAPFVVLSHDAGDDPRFTYANLTAQRLFERPWDSLVGLPSRLSAEADEREARAVLLERVRRDGFIDDYTGIRVARSGHRFRIAATTVWNLEDATGRRVGQAAMFSAWVALEGSPAEHGAESHENDATSD
jgi:MEKHLA domain